MAASPVRLVRRQVKPGTLRASVFSLIIICLGAGTITLPYVYYLNGVLLGSFFILLAAGLSYYTGSLIAHCAEKTGGSCFEEIAYHLYGSKGLKITSFCNILCNMGFAISYIVLVSSSF